MLIQKMQKRGKYEIRYEYPHGMVLRYCKKIVIPRIDIGNRLQVISGKVRCGHDNRGPVQGFSSGVSLTRESSYEMFEPEGF
jgi:hypothetical protein